MGARLMQVVTEARIEWKVSRTWRGDRALERWLKNRMEAPVLCPICDPKAMKLAKEKNRCQTKSPRLNQLDWFDAKTLREVFFYAEMRLHAGLLNRIL